MLGHDTVMLVCLALAWIYQAYWWGFTESLCHCLFESAQNYPGQSGFVDINCSPAKSFKASCVFISIYISACFNKYILFHVVQSGMPSNKKVKTEQGEKLLQIIRDTAFFLIMLFCLDCVFKSQYIHQHSLFPIHIKDKKCKGSLFAQ